MNLHSLLVACLATLGATSQACETDEDCSLNGLCRRQSPWSKLGEKSCKCDPGWFGEDCGHLDLRPAIKDNGYNHSADAVDSMHLGLYGNSSWGGTVVQDPQDPSLFHLVAAQFASGCGLSGWRPFSFIIRAESRNGPQGPYHYAESISEPFRHNPEVIWSPADEKYLLYSIGADDEEQPREKCASISYKRWPNNISVSTAPDIRGPWTPFKLVLASADPHSTNPSPWPLWTPQTRTSKIALGVEDIAIFLFDRYDSAYELVHTQSWNTSEYSPTWTEDSFLWRDKRGHWHALAHWMIDLVEDGQKWPRVGAHVFARELTGPWHLHLHEAFNSTVTYSDGTVRTLKRRERAKIFFSNDGEMTPLYLVNGVQEMGEGSRSSTFVQPIGEAWKDFEKRLGF
ncbi:uncharacterized protein DSM5745_00512 [Aspergillus mulundensis]|uniref:EGF-like domain-containing protein n=1 Tax=Aspergillus mulundensis TaxID=1810919 RepID=A0A3D8T3S8_9EURO|nr:Uncharacterized protein DSM5745_00512 [Aspergillus mulundensis]RDW93190.1 Uncharacterized protein DSM5745_00512 [Aspergillus mulundensis]